MNHTPTHHRVEENSSGQFHNKVSYLDPFFWGYVMSKTFGGRIAEIIGPRECISLSLLVCGMLLCLAPWAAYISPYALAAIQLTLGLCEGPVFPAIYSLLSRWASQKQKATTFILATSGTAIGCIGSMAGSGIVIEVLGWHWVFWGGGLLSFALLPAWLLFVRNSPDDHPLMSDHEKNILEANCHVIRPRNAPWGRLLRCWRLHAVIFTEFVFCWITNLCFMEAPTFLSNKIGFGLLEASWVLGIAQAVKLVAGIIVGWASDFIAKKEILSQVNSRRLFHILATLCVCICLLMLSQVGCASTEAATLMVLLTASLTLGSGSYVLAPFDMAPNYS
ncbi:unnamed protein product, partial [Meganyctiphanes norvegica]